jgi:hypothetical protein
MARRTMTVPLKGFGSPPSTAQVEVETLTLQQRVIRSLAIIALGFALALVALPIPLVHFVLVPASLLLGLMIGANRFRQREIFALAEGPCPFCGTKQRLGLAGRAFRLPRQVHCRNCGRALDLGEDGVVTP